MIYVMISLVHYPLQMMATVSSILHKYPVLTYVKMSNVYVGILGQVAQRLEMSYYICVSAKCAYF